MKLKEKNAFVLFGFLFPPFLYQKKTIAIGQPVKEYQPHFKLFAEVDIIWCRNIFATSFPKFLVTFWCDTKPRRGMQKKGCGYSYKNGLFFQIVQLGPILGAAGPNAKHFLQVLHPCRGPYSPAAMVRQLVVALLPSALRGGGEISS